MKHLTGLFLSICVLFSLTACGTADKERDSSPSRTESSGFTESSSTEASSSVSGENPGEASADPEESVPEAVETTRDPLPGVIDLERENGSLIQFVSQEDFSSFTVNGASSGGDGSFRLNQDGDHYQPLGVCTSPLIKTDEFTELMLSWNASLPLTTSVELEVRVRILQPQPDSSGKEIWSQWFSFGEYAPGVERVITDQEDELASFQSGVLTTNGNPASALQLRATLRTSDISLTPTLRSVYVSLRDGRNAAPGDSGDIEDDVNWLVTLAVPSVSQQQCHTFISETASVPCCLSMLMTEQGLEMLPEVIALASGENSCTNFNNLSFGTAFAGACGFDAYAAYTDLSGLKREIAAGYPAAIMVSYTGDPDSTSGLPFVEGAPGEQRDHMVVLRGFTAINGELYAVVNDPAAETAGQVRKTYRLDQLMAAWDGRACFVHPSENGTENPIEERKLELRAEGDGFRLYNPDSGSPFKYGEHSVFIQMKDGKVVSFLHPVHNSIFLLDKSASGCELWVVTDLGILYRADIPTE